MGLAKDVDGKSVQGYAIIHRKDALAKNTQGPGDSQKCYSYLADGAKWRVEENYLVDPTNTRGLSADVVRGIVSGAVAKWETAAGVTTPVGSEVEGTVDGADTVAPDGKNEVMFGNVGNTGGVAITLVWGVFSGPMDSRELVEWDQIYDQVDFDWSAEATGVAGKMDFDNIATHEIGHAFGMGHPGGAFFFCTNETMYRSTRLEEIKKRDLNTGDITGIDLLY